MGQDPLASGVPHFSFSTWAACTCVQDGGHRAKDFYILPPPSLSLFPPLPGSEGVPRFGPSRTEEIVVSTMGIWASMDLPAHPRGVAAPLGTPGQLIFLGSCSFTFLLLPTPSITVLLDWRQVQVMFVLALSVLRDSLIWPTGALPAMLSAGFLPVTHAYRGGGAILSAA